VHDLGFRHFPEAHPALQRAYLEWTTQHSANRATRLLADSQATACDLAAWYGANDEVIRVVYPGVSPAAAVRVEAITAARAAFGIPPRYLLFIGTLQPRKNIARMVQAFACYCTAHPDDSTALVLAGARGWLYDPVWTAGVPNVITTGYLDEASKQALLAGASAFVFPSLYEGFGFPILEAMHAGVPVLCSNTSSLPELAGDAARLPRGWRDCCTTGRCARR
jgi:glycosyltransferase involved in cell wall biosynthesis